MNKRLLVLIVAASVASTLFFMSNSVDAVATRHFTLDDAESLSGGELEGTMVHSRGFVSVGVGVARVQLEGAALAYCVARAQDGTLFIGSGDAGRIFQVQNDRVSVFAETGQLLVSSLVIIGDIVYAGTLPEGRIFAINRRDGAISEFARPDGAEHVWDLVSMRGQLFAATGPEGKIFAIDPQGRVELYADTDASHVMSLAVDGETLFAGTGEDAAVYRISAPGQMEVVREVPGTEITALVAREGTLALIANEMPQPRSKVSNSKAAPQAPRAGKGRVWRIDSSGRAERVFHRDDEHFTSLAMNEEETIFVGSGKEARVFQIARDRTSAIWADVDERQVLDIDLQGTTPVFVTGDSGALYRTDSRPEVSQWTSRVLDASFFSRFGQLTWRGSGRIDFQTRSGNTSTPDDTWTEWSASLRVPGPVRSPGARFVQIRASFHDDAILRAVQLYYLPQNQRAVITSVGLKTSRSKSQDAISAPSSEYELTWEVDNPDDDALRYRLRYRQEHQTRWRSMFPEEIHHVETTYKWETSGLSDGWYVVEVEASDESVNPIATVLRNTVQSEPLLIDNHAPQIEQLRVHQGRISGRTVDSLGPIAKLEMAIDGGDWRPIPAVDQLLDTAEERFSVELPPLEEGDHIFAIRATDSGGNWASAEIAESP